jgi:hypothetical protein
MRQDVAQSGKNNISYKQFAVPFPNYLRISTNIHVDQTKSQVMSIVICRTAPFLAR